MPASGWAAEMDDIVTSVALIIGGIWAGYRWGYTEWQRKRREQLDLDGTLTALSVPLPAGKAYLTLQAAWNNPGPLPITMCTEGSYVEQKTLPENPLAGSLSPADCKGAVTISRIPLTERGYTVYKMGPQTVSIMTVHFVIEAGAIYLFTWKICLGAISRKNRNHREPHSEDDSYCSRDLIWALPREISGAKGGIKE
jgi:hypothetical protein